MSHFSPKKIFAPYICFSAEEVASFSAVIIAGGVNYEISPMPMLDGRFALPLNILNHTELPSDMFDALSAIDPEVVTCCDFQDHTDLHKIV